MFLMFGFRVEAPIGVEVEYGIRPIQLQCCLIIGPGSFLSGSIITYIVLPLVAHTDVDNVRICHTPFPFRHTYI